LSVVLIASIATPALAQSYNPEFGTGNVSDMPQAVRSNNGDANSAYAHEPSPMQSHASPRQTDRWNSATMEQYQTPPNHDENY
jgi:hypothetical protein